MTPAELARDRESVSHILKSAARLAEAAAAGRDAFDASWVPRSAARWEVQVMGEAAGRLSEGFRAAYPDVAVGRAKRVRNIFVHQYDVVDEDEVWVAITAAVPEFASSLRALAEFAPSTGIDV